MKLWIDDVRPAPEGYAWAKSVNQAKEAIVRRESWEGFPFPASPCGKITRFELIDIDYDAGDYACFGGDYVKLLDWLEETGRNYPIHIHSMNPVGVQNMRMIIHKNNWVEVP